MCCNLSVTGCTHIYAFAEVHYKWRTNQKRELHYPLYSLLILSGQTYNIYYTYCRKVYGCWIYLGYVLIFSFSAETIYYVRYRFLALAVNIGMHSL